MGNSKKARKVGLSHVTGPRGKKPNRAEAEAMAAALFDSITPEVASSARSQENS
jgi:hypothetical protein